MMVMTEMKKPRDTFVLGRGQYDNPGEKVTQTFRRSCRRCRRVGRQSSVPGEVAGGPEEPADRASGGQPLLAGLLWRRAL